ncbi:outer membrane lipid asymmetry maintenance protein MlaD [Methylotenera mobilis]|uniref:Mammalian cell entry related domain protein n=1 Tax=Methylotenera mobilis (strain JLW8 / ATCC BAA-1282 / DSM 17540) TaxID=583345 RepID=C6WSX0_METML|nr:outer membrane lipid asymmetry maintenance protein MlaD [Methylotenera mobilis]ACT47212.1 Mammalian cell entry related domain protein [Methylotenera mobilis JLW8]
MDRTKIDLWVGIFVALGAAALLGLAMKVGNLTSSKIGETYSVSASFENIGGLKPSAPVKSAGVVVGRVADISFDAKSYVAVVTIKIDKRYQFPKDTFANIYTAGLLGEQYIGLEAGGEDDVLKAGDKISQTQDAIVLEKMISQFLYNKASESDNDKAAAPATGEPAKAKSTELGDAPF